MKPVVRKRLKNNEKRLEEMREMLYNQEYGMGSWLREGNTGTGMMSGMATGAAAGALAGAPAGGVGAIPGAIIGGVSGMIGGLVKGRKQANEDAVNGASVELNANQSMAQQRLSQYGQQQIIPTFGLGGDVNAISERNNMGYKYYDLGGNINEQSTMKGYGYNLMPNGGYVENPAWYRSNALSMAKGGHLPEGKATLKEAKDLMKLYPDEMKAGEEVEYEHTGNKKFAQRIAADHIKDHLQMTGGKDPGYYKHLQEAGISDELNKMPQMAKGGFIKPEKAKAILKDGTIKGKTLTDRQKRYFGFIASGGVPNKADGGPLDTTKSLAERPLSDLELNNKIVEYKYHENLDSVNAMTPQQRQALIPFGSPLRFEKVDKGTANSGGYKYYEKILPKQKPIASTTYMDSTQYGTGGLLDKIPSTGRILDNNKTGNLNNGTTNNPTIFTEYKGGGTHSQNSLGGIPIGDKAKVEEGEIRINFGDKEDYIFSNQIAYNKK